MKKKWSLILASVVTVSAVISSVALADQDWWSKFQKKEGIFKVESGVPVQVAGEKEKNAVIDSIEPTTGIPQLTLSELFWDSTAKVKAISTTIDNKEIEFQFRTQPKLDEHMLFSLPGQGYYLIAIPNSYQYIMEYNGNLYVVDGKQSLITPLLKDKIDQYDINDLANETIENFVPEWATAPQLSPDGKKVVFHSTRNTVYDGNGNGAMWVKYLSGEDEYRVMEGSYTFIGFGLNEDVYYKREDRVEKVNLITKKSEAIVDFSLYAAVVGDKLIYQPDYNALSVIDLTSKTEQAVSIEGIGGVFNIWTYPDSPWIIMENQPDRTVPISHLIIYNVNTKEYKQLSSSPDTTIIYVEWITSDQFIVSVDRRGEDQEMTYIINLEDVR